MAGSLRLVSYVPSHKMSTSSIFNYCPGPSYRGLIDETAINDPANATPQGLQKQAEAEVTEVVSIISCSESILTGFSASSEEDTEPCLKPKTNLATHTRTHYYSSWMCTPSVRSATRVYCYEFYCRTIDVYLLSLNKHH